MAQYIDKDALVAEIERKLNSYHPTEITSGRYALIGLLDFINTLEVKDPYEQCVQYDSIKAGIQAHAETYSFNIESNLFNQLTKEQQKLWRKEIEQACVNGGEVGAELARDTRYKENLEVKEVDLNKELSYEDYKSFFEKHPDLSDDWGLEESWTFAQYFFELGLNTKQTSEDIKIGETQIYLDDDGGEPPYDGKQWLDLSCTEYEIPVDKFKDGDKVELVIRKKQKGE